VIPYRTPNRTKMPEKLGSARLATQFLPADSAANGGRSCGDRPMPKVVAVAAEVFLAGATSATP
jgi:hypothetical protein